MPEAPANADDDLFTLVMLIIGSFGAIVAAAATLGRAAWTDAVTWLLEHHLIVPRRAEPIFALPHSYGAGLDYPRACILAAASLLVVMTAFQAARRRRLARRHALT